MLLEPARGFRPIKVRASGDSETQSDSREFPSVTRKSIILYPTLYRGMQSSVLDEKRRVVLPKDMAEKLGLAEGTSLTFESKKDAIIMRKEMKKKDALREMMSWNPTRTKRPQRVAESEVKEIWG